MPVGRWVVGKGFSELWCVGAIGSGIAEREGAGDGITVAKGLDIMFQYII